MSLATASTGNGRTRAGKGVIVRIRHAQEQLSGGTVSGEGIDRAFDRYYDRLIERGLRLT